MTRLLLGISGLLVVPALHAWDYNGHRIINLLALKGLPAEFPAFVHSTEATERIAFLSGEPDRWRNVSDLPIKHCNGLDHYVDMEELAEAGLDLNAISPLRYSFAVTFAEARKAHADKFPAIDPSKNTDGSREWPGFLPWAIVENYGKLKSAFSYLKTYESCGGTSEEIANARANIIFIMGVMGHYVGDGCQPLHTTIHHHGWVGENPHGYTTAKGIHQWIDGGFIEKTGIDYGLLSSKARPARSLITDSSTDQRDPVFVSTLSYLSAQYDRVEPLYKLEKDGQLSADGPHEAGKAFIEEQLLRGGDMLSSIWLTAWNQATIDTYLKSALSKRVESHPEKKTTELSK